MTVQTLISDHVWRVLKDGYGSRTGRRGGPRIGPGMCAYLGRCNRPASDHITTAEYRRQREAGAS